MNWLQDVQSIIGGEKSGGALGNLGNLLAPAALGGLVGALLAGGSARKFAGNALLIGGGATLGVALWNKYKGRLTSGPGASAGEVAAETPTPPEARVERLVRALVFAAKSDGHIDAKEQQAIQENLKQLNLGAEAEEFVRQAMAQPLEPKLLAEGVKTEAEALEVYLLSCAVVDIDHFMERGYLDALAVALGIPEDVKQGLEKDVRGAA